MLNKLVFKTSFFLLSIIFLLQLLTSCSQESTNPLAKNYHNTTARYNAYFIAKERMKEVEAIMWKNNVDDFNKILNVFPDLQHSDTAAVGAPANDGIKKASIAIQRHKKSKWTDKSFILIGRLRFYLKDFKNATETFKYVNTKGKDKDAKHAALINIMRLFVENKQYEDAVSVANYLRKEHLNKVNEKDLNLVKAYYFARQKDYKKVESYIGFAIPGVDELSVRSRYYFIIGQIRQMNGNDKDAYTSYRAALKNTPTFEIAFYSRLSLAQVSKVNDKGDVKKVYKDFAKLLKDIRNEDFKDKIYYEMAKFELKQDNTDKAMDYLKQSVASSTINQKQKAYSYLLMGELYYEKLKKYELAKSYYDSTIALLPQSEEIYDVTLKRQKSLANFVTQINTIHTEDSLQRLAKMDTTTLNQYLAKVEEDQKAAAENKQANNSSDNGSFSSVFDQDPDANFRNASRTNEDDNKSAGNWYFYSVAAISRGKTEFVRNWGNRTLEDNWRLSEKGQIIAQNEDTSDSIVDASNSETGSLGSTFDKQLFLSQLPRTEEALKESNLKIEEAYFTLGKIYDQELEEVPNSIQTFETLLKRYPETQHKSEIYYYLYLLYGKTKSNFQNEYKQKLASEFPNSFYNKLINNPDYLSDNKKEEKIINQIYDRAYTLYERENFEGAKSLIDSANQKLPGNIILDKFSLLKILISGKTEDRKIYVSNLNDFMVLFPESSLIPYAQQLLLKAQNGSNNLGQNEEIGTIYKPDLENKPHYFFILYPAATDVDENLRKDIITFNQSTPEDKNLSVDIQKDDPSTKIILVKQFSNKSHALTYYARFKENSNIISKYNGINLNVFIISDENFKTFNQNKDVNSYLSFFERTY